MIAEKILQYLNEEGKTIDEAIVYEVGLQAQWSFKRQFMTDATDSKGKLRLSSAGKCPRQLAYGYHGVEKNGKELDARSKLTFFSGDLIEIVITQLAKVALKKQSGALFATGKDQIEVELSLNGITIKGHPDGLYLQDGIMRLVEVKSMSSFGFKKFENGDIDDSYLAQINMYMNALGLEEAIVIAYDKNSNVIGEQVIKKDVTIIKGCKENMAKVLNSTIAKLPEPRYGADVKGFYPFNCRYCSWYGVCWPKAKLVLCGRAYKLKAGEKTISKQQQEALVSGYRAFGVLIEILEEYLEINYGVKEISQILEKDYKAVKEWVVDTGTVQEDLKEELKT